MPETAPYGSWKSPITSDVIVTNNIGLSQLSVEGSSIYWLEAHPEEKGRVTIVRRSRDGEIHALLPAPWYARTRVHEYGGASYLVHDSVLYFSNFSDQRLYRLVPGGEPEPLSPPEGYRYADYIMDTRRNRLIGVREDHTASDREAVNTIASITLNGSDVQRGGQVLVSGKDFYSDPRLNPDGTRLCWLEWSHPNMPWDGTELWVAEISQDGALENAARVAGGPSESIFQPSWSPDGRLYFASDLTGWWNLYRWENGQSEALHPMEAEFASPQWAFGTKSFAFETPDQIICIYVVKGEAFLAELNTRSLNFTPIPLPYSDFESISTMPGRVFFLGGSPVTPDSLVQLDRTSGTTSVLRKSTPAQVDPGYISIPQGIEFPTAGGRSAYAFYYPPKNKDYTAPAGDLPPLIVVCHGGPTGATSAVFSLGIQFWTSRGFAVVDVNYGGSTGYGRAYRERLKGQWGIVDVDDCTNAALYLVKTGKADPNRLAIRGGSAGGYTTLAALALRDVFQAGASYFGVSDAEALALDTHKFESRYLDGLIGPYPEARDVYLARSPIHFTDQFNCALILLQGAEDKVVPPDQSRKMFEAVRAKGLPVAYLEFPGEQHGFRQSEHIKRAQDSELYFYSRVFNFPLADPVEPVEIENI